MKTKTTVNANQKSITVRAESAIVRRSARKVRLAAAAIRGINRPGEAISVLEMVVNQAAGELIKTLKQAAANAKNNFNLAEETLKIKTIEVNEGPTMKRARFGSRGRIKPILKRTSRIKVTLLGQIRI
jgi:large subunit ribosomal protein L22